MNEEYSLQEEKETGTVDYPSSQSPVFISTNEEHYKKKQGNKLMKIFGIYQFSSYDKHNFHQSASS